MGKASSTHQNLEWVMKRKPEGKRPVGKFRRRLEDNTKKDFKQIEWGDMDWIHLA
jgi:hypothetical protein